MKQGQLIESAAGSRGVPNGWELIIPLGNRAALQLICDQEKNILIGLNANNEARSASDCLADDTLCRWRRNIGVVIGHMPFCAVAVFHDAGDGYFLVRKLDLTDGASTRLQG